MHKTTENTGRMNCIQILFKKKKREIIINVQFNKTKFTSIYPRGGGISPPFITK